MAIKREVTVTITGAKSSLDGKIIVFRNDRGIDLHLTFKNFDYIIGDLVTPVMSATATVAKPNGYDKFDVELTVIDETVIFTITNDMTDEMEEVGVTRYRFTSSIKRVTEYLYHHFHSQLSHLLMMN